MDSFLVGCCLYGLFLVCSMIGSARIFVDMLSAAAEVLGHPCPYLGEDREASDVRPFFRSRARLVVHLGQVHTNDSEKGKSDHPVPALDRNPSSPLLGSR